MSEPIPFHKRTLDSFADHIITKARPRKDGAWHAVFDCSFVIWVSDPDFATYGHAKDAAEAHARCAKGIRDNAKGIGKFAPHSIFKDSYDLHWRLMKHWSLKERFEAVGSDPNEMMMLADNVDWNNWSLSGEWINLSQDNRAVEFRYQLAVAEHTFAFKEGKLSIDQLKDSIISAVKEHFIETCYRSSPTKKTWTMLNERIDDVLMPLSVEHTGPTL